MPTLVRAQPDPIVVLQVPRAEVLEAFPSPEQVQQVLAHCEGELDGFGLLGALLSGQHTLWVHETGWTITGPWGQWLDIICMYDSEWGNAEHVLNWFWEKSKEWQMKGIRTLNLRPGAARRAQEWGFRPRLVEYVKDA